jgi:hypothetical protein
MGCRGRRRIPGCFGMRLKVCSVLSIGRILRTGIHGSWMRGSRR